MDTTVIATSVLVVASQGPFGPTAATCLLLPVLLLGPFVLLAIAARSLLGADPLPWWLVALTVLGTVGLAYLLWPAEMPSGRSGFWTLWRVASIGAILLLPAVLLREGGKRSWFRTVGRHKSRRARRDGPSAKANPHRDESE